MRIQCILCWTTFCAAQALMASHRSGGIQMNLAVICIYQEPFKIRLNNDHFQKMLLKSLELSSDKTGGEYFSISIILGHVSSWRPARSIQKIAVRIPSKVGDTYLTALSRIAPLIFQKTNFMEEKFILLFE